MNRYRIVDTALGYCAVVFSVDPFCFLQARLPCANIQSLCQLFDERDWMMDSEQPEAADIVASLTRYFEGGKVDVPWPVMNLARFTPAQQTVYRTVATIPYGETASYGQVARMANLPRAARFVGNTMARNPYPVFIPCHRVIRSDGSVGGFGGSIGLKEKMLALEKGTNIVDVV